MMKILPSFGPIAFGPIHKARIQKSEQEVEFTRQFLESIKLELEMRVADKSDPLWQRRILNEWPIVRVKRIMKRSSISKWGRPSKISADAVYLMAYATRVFLRLITARAAQFMIAEKRTTLLVRDIIAAVKGSSSCDFLLDIVDEWEQSHMSTTPKRGRKAAEAQAALSNQGLKPAASEQELKPAPSTLLPLPPTGSGAAHQERADYCSLAPLALPMPETGWETPQAGSFDFGAELGAELRQWGSESACLLSTGIAIDWGAAQLALEPDSFELDGELAQWAAGD